MNKKFLIRANNEEFLIEALYRQLNSLGYKTRCEMKNNKVYGIGNSLYGDYTEITPIFVKELLDIPYDATFNLPDDYLRAVDYAKTNLVTTPKYKAGDWVTVRDTPNVRSWSHGEKAIGYTFKLRENDKVCEYLDVFLAGQGSAVDFDNKYSINYLITDVRPATTEEIKKAETKIKAEELLKEAARRYPIGTKFAPAHLTGNSFSIVTTQNFEFVNTENPEVLIALTPDGKRTALYSGASQGNHDYNRVVYHCGKWADIIKEPNIGIMGYKVEFLDSNGTIRCGCKTLSKENVNLIYDLIQRNLLIVNPSERESVQKVFETINK